jgi:hypothetical protein
MGDEQTTASDPAFLHAHSALVARSRRARVARQTNLVAAASPVRLGRPRLIAKVARVKPVLPPAWAPGVVASDRTVGVAS